MNSRILLLIGFAILACGVLLLQSYREYAKTVETLITLLALTTSVVAIYDFIKKK
jgi:hypothetical protein